MKVLIDEYAAGGGMAGTPLNDIPPSLLREGRAMLAAVAADFARIPGVQPLVLRDERFADLELPGCKVVISKSPGDDLQHLQRLASEVDWTLVIAPEFDDLLLARCLAVEAAGGKLLGPASDLVRRAADKHATAEMLRLKGVLAPRGVCLNAGDEIPGDFALPAVLKPRYGAGSLGVEAIANRGSTPRTVAQASRLEAHCPGTAVSVALLSGPGGGGSLPPCRQLLGGESGFEYLGGELLADAGLRNRAMTLIAHVVAVVYPWQGWIGVDVVLGADREGSQDFVIEINPRLTTSYVGLRAASAVNLAEAIWKFAAGEAFDLKLDKWRPQVRWTADGRVESRRQKRDGRPNDSAALPR